VIVPCVVRWVSPEAVGVEFVATELGPKAIERLRRLTNAIRAA
jgi:hypothetical protein